MSSLEIQKEPVVFFDAQTTGMRPPAARLIELGWAFGCGGKVLESSEVLTKLVRLPEGEALSSTVAQLTGLSDSVLARGSSLSDVYQNLVSELSARQPRFAVIHYAQFEKPFLKDLFLQGCGNDELPFEIICSHHLAKKLFPNLPNNNIRAMAGFFGSSHQDFKRASHHVEVTSLIWRGLVAELQQRGIITFSQLNDWLISAPKVKRDKYEYRIDKVKRLQLPDSPGIYRMLSKNRDVLYVGKATSLKSRVNSYFRGQKGRDHKKLEMLAQVWDLEVVPCETALQAALLENDEIKKYDPPYNVSLKAGQRRLVFYDKTFSRVALESSEDYSCGPFRTGNAIEQVRMLDESLAKDLTLGVFYVPVEVSVMREGYEIFRAKYLGSQKMSMRRFLALGLAFWRKRRGKKEEDVPDDVDESDVITPTEVSEKLERLLMRGGAEYHRTKVLTRLLNSKISWQVKSQWKSLSFCEGHILDPLENRPQTRAKSPWDGLKVQDFDRMSVLLSELNKHPHRILWGASLESDVRHPE